MMNNPKEKQGYKGQGRQTGYQGKRPRFRNQRFMGGRQNENRSKKFPTRSNTWQRDPQKQTSKCFRCSGTGHIKRDCQVQSHLVKLYQASMHTTKTGIMNNYLGIDEDLTKYKHPTPPPEAHTVTDTSTDLSISDDEMCIIDSGTSHTILKDKRYFQSTPVQPPSDNHHRHQ